jgi:outer membrane receptor protein involved in Fe transport
MADFLRVSTLSHTTVDEFRLTGFVRGNVIDLPAGPVAAVVGFEYRDTSSDLANDANQRAGNVAGFNAQQDQTGEIQVTEAFSEFSVPLIADQFLAQYLGLELGYRVSSYSTVGAVETYKIGGEFSPAEWLRFRVMFNEATRAPNVFELFQAGDQSFPGYFDPCTDGFGNEAACMAAPGAAAVNPAAYPGFEQPRAQVQTFAFGNLNLRPETAETTTYGVVLAPDWSILSDFRLSIDYYSVDITDVIAALDANFFLEDCYINLSVESCARIIRDGGTGEVVSIDTSRSNQASRATEGYDIQLEWSVPIGPGRLTINELYSIIESWTINGFDVKGTTDGGSSLPDSQSVFSATYAIGDWTFFGRWLYVPEMVSGQLSDFFFIAPIPEASYIDAAVRWSATPHFTLTATVDNLLDEYPPQTADGIFQAGSDQVFRPLGRTFTLSGRYRF